MWPPLICYVTNRFGRAATLAEYEIFELGDVVLQSGITLPDAKLAFKTYGELNSSKDNVILYPSRFGGGHVENEIMIGEGRALDPTKYFIVVPNMFGNGLSSSPSNTPPPNDRSRFPNATLADNVTLEHRLLVERFGIGEIALVIGWSMAAQCAYQWAALYPDMVKRLVSLCGSARTSRHNYVFLDGVKSALTADAAWQGGDYDAPPAVGLRAMSRVYAGWAFSQAFYREKLYEKLGYPSLEGFLVDYWEATYVSRDANDMLSQIWTWQHADISANELYKGDFEKALGAIMARAFIMPCDHDLYFLVTDNAYEVDHMPNAELRVIRSPHGHMSAGDKDPADTKFIDETIKELLGA